MHVYINKYIVKFCTKLGTEILKTFVAFYRDYQTMSIKVHFICSIRNCLLIDYIW